MTVKFQIETDEWDDIPKWVSFFVRFGLGLPESNARQAIYIVTTPCDCAAVGLIGLGLLIRDLQKPNATDMAMHFERLRRLLTSENNARRVYRIGENLAQRQYFRFGRYFNYDPNRLQVTRNQQGRGQNQQYSSEINRDNAHNWCLEGESPVVVNNGNQGIPYREFYEAFVPDVCDQAKNSLKSNLHQSYSGIGIAGRVTGLSKTRGVFKSVKLALGDTDVSLDDLLTLNDSNNPSRMVIYNTRNEKFENRYDDLNSDNLDNGIVPKTIVADGIRAFKVIYGKHKLFTNLIAVVDRSQHDLYDESFAFPQDLNDCYEPGDIGFLNTKDLPNGISICCLQKRVNEGEPE